MLYDYEYWKGLMTLTLLPIKTSQGSVHALLLVSGDVLCNVARSSYCRLWEKHDVPFVRSSIKWLEMNGNFNTPHA